MYYEHLVEKIEDFVCFYTPCVITLVGPSNTGKSVLLAGILEKQDTIFEHKPKKIIFVYSEWQDLYEKISANKKINIRFVRELDETICDEFDKNEHTLLICDDFQMQIRENPLIARLCVQMSHHRNVTLILVLQNYFFGSKSSDLDIRRSTQYCVFTKSLQDMQMIRAFAVKTFPNKVKEFMEIYNDAVTTKKYGHLLIDSHMQTPQNLRLRANILSECPTIYTIK